MSGIKRILLGLLFVTAVGCAPKKIPGTEIDDTDDSRQILDIMEAYRKAVETKDAQTIVNLADENFKDDGGTSNPSDDLDYKTLYTVLPERMMKMEDVRLELGIRKIEVSKDKQSARATYTYSTSFRIPSLSTKTQSDGDIKQMNFRRHPGKDSKKDVWKIVSGI